MLNMLIDQAEAAQVKSLENNSNSTNSNFSVMTLNVRDPGGIHGGYPEREWDDEKDCGYEHTRRYRLVHQILANRPAFACLEEFKYGEEQGNDITHDLEANGYKEIYIPVQHNGHYVDTALFYDASKVSIAKDNQGHDISGYQGLGMKPYNGWGPVGIVWGKFIDKATGKDVLICATHFGQQGHDPKIDTWHFHSSDFEGAMNVIRQKCGVDGQTIPTVMAGDFNMDPAELDGHSAFRDGWKDVYNEQGTTTYDMGKFSSWTDRYHEPVTRHGGGAWNDGGKDGYWGHTDDGQFAKGLNVNRNDVLADNDTKFSSRGPAFVSDHFGEVTNYSFESNSMSKGSSEKLDPKSLSAINKFVIQAGIICNEALFTNKIQQLQA